MNEKKTEGAKTKSAEKGKKEYKNQRKTKT